MAIHIDTLPSQDDKTHPSSTGQKGVITMTRRLLLAYLLVVFGPLAAAAIAFALRDLVARRRPASSDSDGHTESEALEHTVKEVQAT